MIDTNCLYMLMIPAAIMIGMIIYLLTKIIIFQIQDDDNTNY